MTKLEMVDKISESVTLPKNEIEKILDQFVAVTQNTLKSGDKVSLTGLGVFTPKERAARTARNPKTGEKVAVPAKKVVKFKPGKELAELLQNPAPEKNV
jgi:DNA-binding protein HU-beta